MATTIKPTLSKKNNNWIDKHRYYELKHFCLQYPEWKKLYSEIDGLGASRTEDVAARTNTPPDNVYRCVELRSAYLKRIELVEKTAIQADPSLASYILKAVTEGLSYNALKARLEIPCGRDTYYSCYRRFFWLLDRETLYI